MQMKKFLETRENLIGLSLVVVTLLLITGLFLPWISMNFQWSSSSALTEGDIQFHSNGLGSAYFQGYFFYGNRSDPSNPLINQTVEKSSMIPFQLGIGASIIGFILLNTVMAASFIFQSFTQQIFPKQIQDVLKEKWDTILLIEGIIILAFVSLFSTVFFDIPIHLTANTPTHFPNTSNTLLDLYKYTYNFFDWATTTLNVSNATWSRNVEPGMGTYITFLAGIILVYIWFINYIRVKKDWPIVWQKRSILLPLMLIMAFMPVARQYSKTQAITVPFLLAPVLNRLAGILYTVLIVAAVYITYQTAMEEKSIDKLTQKLYTIEGDLTDKEFDRITNNINAHRERASTLRKILFPLMISIFSLIVLVFWEFARIYRTFVGEVPGASWLAHTPIDWPLVFAPLFTIMLMILYRR